MVRSTNLSETDQKSKSILHSLSVSTEMKLKGGNRGEMTLLHVSAVWMLVEDSELSGLGWRWCVCVCGEGGAQYPGIAF